MQTFEELKAEILRLKEENAHLAWRNEGKDRLIVELMAWIDSEFRLDTYLPGSPGKKLWDRAQEAIK